MVKSKSNRAAVPPAAIPLSSHDLFQGLPEKLLPELQGGSQVQNFAEDHVFFRLGEVGGVLFLLERGRVETFRTSGRKKLIIAELYAPALFGEMGYLGEGRYHCSARAITAGQVRTIARASLDKVLNNYPLVTRRLLDEVSRRFMRVLLDLDATSFRHRFRGSPSSCWPGHKANPWTA
jgi:CRP-like cAMP-binding protein